MTADPALESKTLRSDEPIREPAQDQLARGRLVEVIAHNVRESSAPDSVVIALNAPWGAGKSSFLNLLEGRLLLDAADGASIVIRFNPWHYTNVEQLVRMFFGELARGVGAANKKDLGRKIGSLLKAAGSLVAMVSSAASSALKEAGTALDQEKSLADFKQELGKLLPELAQRVVVFVDDIDRLERETLRMLFRVIRLNADFPNMTYVLAFDRLVVEKNLDEENGIRGRDYLEKIIQVSFDIPAPESSTLERILFVELDAVLQSQPTRPLDQHRWGNLFHSGFRDHFRTIRHIKRYVNGLRLTLPPVAVEVDLVDFLGVELVRVFHPEAYLALVGSKDVVAPSQMARSAGTLSKERLGEWLASTVGKASPGLEKSTRGLLKELFPQLARVDSNMLYGDGSYSEWRRNGRVCSDEIFDKFFLLAIPHGEISETELQGFVDALSNPEVARGFLNDAIEAGKARRLVERLEDYTKELPEDVVPSLVRVLFAEGDRLQFESRGMMDFSAGLQVGRVVYQCLMRMTEEQRATLLLELVTSTPSLFTIVQETALCEPKDAEGSRVLTDRAQWEKIRDAATAQVIAAAHTGQLWSISRLPYVLFRWREWTDEVAVRAAVSARTASDDGLLAFVAAFVEASHSHGMGDKVARRHVRISKKALGYFVDVNDVLRRLSSMVAAQGAKSDQARELLAHLEAKATPWEDE